MSGDGDDKQLPTQSNADQVSEFPAKVAATPVVRSADGRGRLIFASKDRVEEGEITSYEQLADEKWEGRICTRSSAAAS